MASSPRPSPRARARFPEVPQVAAFDTAFHHSLPPVGNRLGYGYGSRALIVELFNQNSINWTSLEPVSYAGAQ